MAESRAFIQPVHLRPGKLSTSLNLRTEVIHTMFIRLPIFRAPQLHRVKTLAARTIPLSEEIFTAEIPAAGPSNYAIARTANQELPVYTDVRNDGGAKTIVRKVTGDASALQRDLRAHLQSVHFDPTRTPPAVTVRPTNQHVEIRGRWVAEVKDFLESRGF